MGAAKSILRAVVRIPSFTVADLVTTCELPAATIRTVLRRHEEWFEEVGRSETGRPGGRWKEYQATAVAHEQARSEHLGESPQVVPTGLVAVEELLLAPDVGELPPETAESLLRRAKRFRAETSSSALNDSRAQLHARVADVLIALTEAELSSERAVWRELRDEIAAWPSGLTAVDVGLMAALDERFVQSPLDDSSSALDVYDAESKVLGKVVDLVSYLVASNAPAVESALPAALHASRPTGVDIAVRARRRTFFAPMFSGMRYAGGDVSVEHGLRPLDGLDLAQGNQLRAWHETACYADVWRLVWP